MKKLKGRLAFWFLFLYSAEIFNAIDLLLAETIECISEDQVEAAFAHLEIAQKEIPVRNFCGNSTFDRNSGKS